MNITAVQMELTSEMRTPAQAFSYAHARERGQQNQKEILRGNKSNWNTTVATYLHAKQNQQYYLNQTQSNTHNVGDAEDPSHPITKIIVHQEYHNATYVKN